VKITNKYGLPDPIINALHRPTYTKGGANVSATELLTSPRIVQLRRKHSKKLEQDASEMVWSLFGSALHNVLEHGKDDRHIVEERLHTTLDGWSISGAIDLQTVENGTIKVSDYKTTGAWAVMNEKADWTSQLNIYAWLVQTTKRIPVSSLEIVAIIRDWAKRESDRNDDYPQAPIVTIPIALWSMEESEEFIRKRIDQHADALMSSETGSDLPKCSPEDMWERQSAWAVKKIKGVRAKSVHYSEEDANKALEVAGKEYAIEFRPGERVRCQNYCAVSKFCEQWAQYRREQ
jgi:hypothetical protein